MKPELYEQYVTLKNLGQKDEARNALNDFIASFDSFDEKQAWTQHFLETGDFGHKVRHELYEQIIFPVLLEGYKRKDVWSILWLVKTSQSRSSNEKALSQLSESPYDLLKQAYNLKPSDEVRRELLQTNINWFAYSQHEWPSGILWDIHGLTLDDSDGILHEIAFTRSLDTENIYAIYLDDYENKVRQYILRLQERHQK